MIYDNDKEVLIRIEIQIYGQRKAYQHIISELDWERISPSKYLPLDSMQAYEEMKKAEERRRLIDMLSGKIAYSLINAINGAIQRD